MQSLEPLVAIDDISKDLIPWLKNLEPALWQGQADLPFGVTLACRLCQSQPV